MLPTTSIRLAAALTIVELLLYNEAAEFISRLNIYYLQSILVKHVLSY